MKRLINIILITLIAGLHSGFAQVNDFSGKDEILAILPKSDKKKLQKADKEYADLNNKLKELKKVDQEIEQMREKAAEADKGDKRKLESKADKLEKKNSKKKIRLSGDFKKVNKTYFTIYKDNFKSVRNNVVDNEAKMTNAKNIEAEANSLYKKAQEQRNKSLRITDLITAYTLLVEAAQFETQAIEKQINAYGIYLGWYDKEDKSKTEDKTEVVEEIIDEPYNEEKTEIVETNENNNADDTEIPDYVEDNSKTETNNETENKYNNYTEDVIYKVQIAASEEPLPLERLKKIYDSNEMINNELEDGWYKYSIGRYDTYQEAELHKNKMGVKDAFIIAYKGGVKVKIAEVNPELVEKRKNDPKYAGNTATNFSNEVVYRIQIAATRVPATDQQMAEMNNTNKMINIVKTGNWYKYTIGNFATKAEAERFAQQNNMNGFVVAYKNGREIR